MAKQKLKTHSGSKKRFSFTKSGKVKFKKAFARHILTKKTSKRMRKLRKGGVMITADAANIKKLMPYS